MGNEINRRVIVIDDNVAIHEDFRKILASRRRTDALDAAAAALFSDVPAPKAPVGPDFHLDFASQGEEGYIKVRDAVLRDERFALAFVDMRMPPGWDGLQTIEKLWEADPTLQIVICSAYSDYSWSDIVARFGVVDRLLILKKPFDTAEVCQLACALTEKWHLAKYAHLKLNQLQSMVEEQTVSLQTEIQERRRSETALRTSEDRYALAVAAANDGLWDWDLSTESIFYSARWKAMFGYTDCEIGSKPCEWFDRVHPDDVQNLRNELQQHIDGKTLSLECEYRAKTRDDKWLWMLCRGLAVRDVSGKATRMAGSQADITSRRMAEEQLRHEATHDVLTGLANRTLLSDQLRRCILQSRRDKSLFAVLFLDLDRFKVINDSLGHAVGDALLIGIAGRLTTCIRGRDTLARIDQQQQLVRLGGDEFVVLLESIGDPADAVRVAQRIQKTFSEPFKLDGHEIYSSGSIGIAIGDGTYESADEILRDADTALYQSKSEGKGCFRIFENAMHVSAVSRLQLENELRYALDRKEFTLHYQPIFSLITGDIVELEALLRWQHPERGLLLPHEFIPVAETTGLIIPLGLWVLNEACAQLNRWQTLLPSRQPLSIAVNVSGKQFAGPGFVEEVQAALTNNHLQANRLHLEITETSAIEGAAPAMEILHRLNALNLQLHLDDFGTGYSSLSYLHRMPVKALKIDRSFIADMGTDTFSQSIVETIITLAHKLKIGVIAEGAQTQEQIAKLRTAGCDLAQGYILAGPMPGENVAAFLSSNSHSDLARCA